MNRSDRKRQRPAHEACHRRQRGAALVVGLVLMLILTLLGVSGMNTASLELTMAANAQAQQLAFQAAESGIEMALTTPVTTTDAYAQASYSFGDGSYQVDTELRCIEMTRVPDGPLREDADARAMHFEVTAAGRGPRNASTRLTQGFYIIVPTTTPSGLEADEPADRDCPAETGCPGSGCIADHAPWLPVRTYWRQDTIDD